MKRATTDRGEIIHAAGFRHLSPGTDARGQPAFSSQAGDGVTRCGWEPFFKALGARHLALAYDADDASTAQLVPAAGAALEGAAGAGGLGHAIEHSRRFWDALVRK